MAKKNSSNGKKIIKTIVGLSVAAGALFGAVYAADSFGLINVFDNTPTVQRLETVDNISYNDDTFVLSWDEVDNADTYVVDINGQTQTTESNEFYYIPTTQTTEFKIQAQDSTGTYTSSYWSSSYTYNVPTNEVTPASVALFADGLISDRGRDVKEVISIYADGNELHTQAVYTYNGVDKLYDLTTYYDSNITSLEDAMFNMENDGTSINDSYEIVKYNSAESLLKSNSFVGQMEEYRQQGYEFSVVSSKTALVNAGDSSEFRIFATYKIGNGIEVKYIQSVMGCGIKNVSSNDVVNYTTRLENVDTRNLVEESCVELTGDFATFAAQQESSNEISTLYASASSYQYNSDWGMDY